MSYVILPQALVPMILAKFLTECVTGQFSLFILVAPCWMEAPWLPTILSMLEDIPQGYPILKDLIMDVLLGWILKSLKLLHLTL